MSAITAPEIITLVAEAWGLERDALAAPAYRDWRQQPFKSASYTARACAIMLIRKHTECSSVQINRALGLSRSTAHQRQEVVVEGFQRFAVRHLDVARRIEAVEQKIDEIHESRVAEKFSGFSVSCVCKAQTLLEENAVS